jgi:hypothetical protein
METRTGSELMRNTLTLVNGRELPRIPDGPMAPWMSLSDRQQELWERGHDPASLVKKQRVPA